MNACTAGNVTQGGDMLARCKWQGDTMVNGIWSYEYGTLLQFVDEGQKAVVVMDGTQYPGQRGTLKRLDIGLVRVTTWFKWMHE